MAKHTASLARNQIARCLREILDPHPSSEDVARLWDYFKHACAYCGKPLNRADRNGHLDHLVPPGAGGTNNIHNLVLACGRCNGDAKREAEWTSFLAATAPPGERRRRGLLIRNWMKQATPARSSGTSAAQLEAEKIIARALRSFNLAVKKLRKLR